MNDELGAPKVVDRSTFQAKVDALRIREKTHTKEGDAIAASHVAEPEDQPTSPIRTRTDGSGSAAHAGQRHALPRSCVGTSDSARRLTTTQVHQHSTSKEPLAAGPQ